jgi:hypothetical protein
LALIYWVFRDCIYYYYFCGGREDKTCDQPYVPVEIMEQAVEAHYGHAVRLPDDFRAKVRALVEAAVATSHNLTDEMRNQYTRRLAKLDAKESYFLDLAAEEGWLKDTPRSKIETIRQERKQIRRELDQAEQQLDTGRAIFHRALELLDDPQALYHRGNETVKTILNRAFFTRLHVDGTRSVSMSYGSRSTCSTRRTYSTESTGRQDGATTAGASLRCTEPPYTGWYGGSGLGSSGSSLTDSLARALCARGSSKAVMVNLLIAYSKRLDLLSELVSAVERLQARDGEAPKTGRSVRSDQAPQVWRVSDRLSEEERHSLVSHYLTGITARELAERLHLMLRSSPAMVGLRCFCC